MKSQALAERYAREAVRALYLERLDAGVCVVCESPLAGTDIAWCADCREDQRVWSKTKRKVGR